METYVSLALARLAYFFIVTDSGGRYYPCTDETIETQLNKFFRVMQVGRLQFNSWRQMTVFPVASNKVTGFSLPDPSWRRHHDL